MAVNVDKCQDVDKLDKHWKAQSLRIKLKLAEWFLTSLSRVPSADSPRAIYDVMQASSAFFKMAGQDLESINDVDGNVPADMQHLVNRITRATSELPDCTVDPLTDKQ